MTQLAISAVNNRNLFSNHYLESLINENLEWKEDVTEAFNRAKKLYNSRKDWNRMDESSLEEFLIRPFLRDVLGHRFVPQAKVELGAKRPDYAFFENEIAVNEAFEKKGIDDFYKKAVAVGDAKSWKTSLDKKVKAAKGSFEFQNPSFQIDHYLHITPVQWGILTNGHHWRIYHKETSYKLDSYYEVDLVTILETNDIEGFKYFYLFFRLNAFIKDASGKNFLERVKEGSIAYAKKLGVNLQENVYKAMKILSEGFFEWNDNGLLKNERDLKEVQDNTLKLLYRLLFIFYAESLRLLDRDNAEYKKLSLESIKNDIANRTDNRELILSVTKDYWNKLDTLFALINEGSESKRFHISKAILYIPAYNGGLFDPERNPFLHSKKVGDEYMAKAIDLLAREEKDFIDYSTLGTRQLGSIYEGLLEYKLKVADEDLVAVKEKGHEKWVTKKEAQGKKTFDEIKAGAIYLATDKGERKATGSYYTPDYIVKYIVRNTLEPILEEKRAAWKEKGLGERPFLHDILGIRVLDPAMGSGHFLVEACEFLANRLVEAWGEAKPEELESEEIAEHDVHWARREVVRHCIFGVDLNPMAVELAKLSLWLETVAANKPLTFLDHHLKVGNSLIGAQVKELKTLPSKEKKEGAENGKKQLKAPTLWDFTVKKHFEELLAKYGEFAAHPDDDLRAVKQKEQEYDALQKSELNRRLHELANVWVSTYFGAAPPPDEYAEMQNEINPKDFPNWSRWRSREWFKEAQRLAGEKRFFHWELEFPESFYEKGALKENPGWDAVVGNPPYVRQELLDSSEKKYMEEKYTVAYASTDLYAYFIEKGVKLLSVGSRLGFICSNKFARTKYGEGLRSFLLKSCRIQEIFDFQDVIVFEGITTYPLILILKAIEEGEDVTDNLLNIGTVRPGFTDLPSHISDITKEIPQKSLGSGYWDLSGMNASGLKEKIERCSIRLKEYIKLSPLVGIKTGFNEAFHINSETAKNLLAAEPLTPIKPLIYGKNIKRYSIEFDGTFLINSTNTTVPDIEKFPNLTKYLYQHRDQILKSYHVRHGANWWQIREPKSDALMTSLKIVYPNVANSCSFTLDNEGMYVDMTGFVIPSSDLYLLTILNSKVVEYVFRSVGVQRRGGYYEFKIQYVEQLPIRRISFTTPPARRAALVEEAKALYSAQAPDGKDSGSSFGTAPNSLKILDFVSARLDAKPEESDVVHDLLAYLAERMIEMNKEKNAEIKGFLDFLKGEIGASIDDLSNKTAIQEYYKHEFQTLIDVLVKNKKKLKAGYDPKNPNNYKILKDWYNDSAGKLAPLLKRIEATDGLIDAIVYRLYGLSEDEIKIVEGSISGGKGREVSKQ